MLKNLSKKLKYIFISLFIITVVIDSLLVFLGFFEITSNVDAGNEIVYFILHNKIVVTFLSFIFIIIYNLLRYSFIIGIYVSIKLGKRKVYHEKLSQIDFQNDNNYFRDIVKNYSPIELSYIDDFKIDYPKDVVAILLSLKQKNFINFNEQRKIIEITNSTLSLSDVENYVLNKIVFGKVRIDDLNIEELTSLTREEAYSNGLLQKDSKKLNIGKIILGMFIAIFLLSMIPNFMEIFYVNSFLETLIGIILILFVIVTPYLFIYSIVYIISYYRHKRINPYVRTGKGEEVNKKLEGLKNYLKDFSYMDERNAEEVIIWEDYLIYSVLFNQNKKVVNEIYNTYFEK